MAFFYRYRLLEDSPLGREWLNLDRIAQVEVTSENHDYPIECAFDFGRAQGWRSGMRGSQTIRLVFDEPQQVQRIWLCFVEPVAERTQEFILRWSSDNAHSFREIIRQQWNFSPHGSTSETEDYSVELNRVSVLELTINPDIGRTEAVATLADLRLM